MGAPDGGLDVAALRASFPILEREINGTRLVYCDSAATSLKPREVVEAEARFYYTIGANVHRGAHALAVEASEAYEGARHTLARFFGAADHEVVFTSNATAALNLVACGLPLEPGDEVLASVNDHHAAILPWIKRGVARMVAAPPDEALDPSMLARLIGPKTRAVVLTHASNVTGVVQPLRELCRVARERGVVTIVDAAQSAPHMRIDVRELDCDFLALSGHKMLGPTGTGALIARREALARIVPRDIGGGTVARATASSFEWGALPARFEPGTPNIAGALGLAAAVRFLERVGFAAMDAHHDALRERARQGIEALPGVRMLTTGTPHALPMVTFALAGLPLSTDVVAATLSDRYGIMVRSGMHCAHPLFERLALHEGALRASFYLYNTLDEIDQLVESLRELLGLFA